MTTLWEAVAQVSIELSIERVEQLARKLSNLRSSEDPKKVLNQYQSHQSVQNLSLVLNQSKVSNLELIAALRASAAVIQTKQQQESIELVWTGPTPGIVPVRHTAQVMSQVIRDAQTQIFIVSYVAYRIEQLVLDLNAAIARGVNVCFLLETSNAQGGNVSVDSIATLKHLLPNAHFYVWDESSKNREIDGFSRSVHAKCLVADASIGFISSANLTSAALERNIELGTLIRGGHVPRQLHELLNSLIVSRTIVLQELPIN
jgi:cardiolipin synthase A/B